MATPTTTTRLGFVIDEVDAKFLDEIWRDMAMRRILYRYHDRRSGINLNVGLKFGNSTVWVPNHAAPSAFRGALSAAITTFLASNNQLDEVVFVPSDAGMLEVCPAETPTAAAVGARSGVVDPDISVGILTYLRFIALMFTQSRGKTLINSIVRGDMNHGNQVSGGRFLVVIVKPERNTQPIFEHQTFQMINMSKRVELSGHTNGLLRLSSVPDFFIFLGRSTGGAILLEQLSASWITSANPSTLLPQFTAISIAHELCHVYWSDTKSDRESAAKEALELLAGVVGDSGDPDERVLQAVVSMKASTMLIADPQNRFRDVVQRVVRGNLARRLRWQRTLEACKAVPVTDARKLLANCFKELPEQFEAYVKTTLLDPRQIDKIFGTELTDDDLGDLLRNFRDLLAELRGTYNPQEPTAEVPERLAQLRSLLAQQLAWDVRIALQELLVTSAPSTVPFTENWIRSSFGLQSRVGHLGRLTMDTAANVALVVGATPERTGLPDPWDEPYAGGTAGGLNNFTQVPEPDHPSEGQLRQ